MEDWKKLITAGNCHFTAENYVNALTKYHESLQCILKGFSMQLTSDPQGAIAAVLVSYFNLADTFVEQGNLDDASLQFESAYCFINRLSHGVYLDEEYASAMCRGFSQLQLEWSLYIQGHAKKLSALHLQKFATAKQTFGETLGETQTVH